MILVVTTCRRTHASAFFFFNDTATTEIYTLSLHDALPILIRGKLKLVLEKDGQRFETILTDRDVVRSEEHTSELQSQSNLVCRLLLEKKKKVDIRLPDLDTIAGTRRDDASHTTAHVAHELA